jgi:protocatechuate 3,4-dioxygenase beta subunit
VHDDDHDRGLCHDLEVLSARVSRRQLLHWAGGMSLVPLLGCQSTTATSGSSPLPRPAPGTACADVPEETAGPFPGDGSNGVDALAMTGITRSDIRASLAGATGVAAGVLLRVTLKVTRRETCAPLAGQLVYVWHCDREGRYSLYSPGVTGESYLRGVQQTDADGNATFTTIFPGCYPGRYPHLHFQVYRGGGDALAARRRVKTSQLALPDQACRSAYSVPGYERSVRTFSRVSLERDGIFGEGAASQLATIAGDASGGYAAELTVPIDG